jgi:hypothetical protein
MREMELGGNNPASSAKNMKRKRSMSFCVFLKKGTFDKNLERATRMRC